MAQISNDWDAPLRPEYKKPYYRDLFNRVVEEYQNYVVYPPSDEIFTAFHLTPLHEVKVVILGQDPYHEEGLSAPTRRFHTEESAGNSSPMRRSVS